MNIIVKSKQHDLDIKLKDYMHQKIEKLDHFFHNTQEIILELEKTSLTSHSERYEAKATVYASGALLHAKERAHDSFAVVDLIYDKLQIQLKKHKEKLSSRKGRRRIKHIQNPPTSQRPQKSLMQDDESLHYIRKPIDIDEAVAILEEKGLSFLMFREMQREKVCVVYPLDNHEYGLIEA